MGMPPVRRAFFILLISAGVVALAAARPGPGDAEGADRRCARPTRDTRPTWRPARVQLTGGNRYTVLTNGDQIFPAMLAAIRGASGASASRPTSTTPATIAEQFTAAFEEAARRGVRVQLVRRCGRRQLDGRCARGAADGAPGAESREFNTPSWYSLEEAELPYPPQDPRRGRRGRRSPAASASTTSGWGTRRTRSTGATRMVSIAGPARPADGRRLLRELRREPPVRPPPVLDDHVPAEPNEEGAAFVVRSSPTGGSNDLKRLYLLAIAVGAQDRSTSPRPTS